MDWEAVFSSEEVESTVALKCLNEMRPQRSPTVALGEVIAENRQPWDSITDIPQHTLRTFDSRRRYVALLNELCPQRPCNSVLLLRLILEEDAIGRPRVGGRSNPRGTRPLTVGEIQENWNEIIRDRCITTWAVEQGIQPSDTKSVESFLDSIDQRLLALHNSWQATNYESYAEAIRLPGQLHDAVTSFITSTLSAGEPVTILLRNTNPLTEAKATRLLKDRLNKYLAEGCESNGNAAARLPSLISISSVAEIEALLEECTTTAQSTLGTSDEGTPATAVTYLSAFWNPVVFLEGAKNGDRRVDFMLAEWAKRHSTFIERSKAKAARRLLFTEEIAMAPSKEILLRIDTAPKKPRK